MKKLIYLIVVIVAFGLIVAGCLPVVPPSEQSEPNIITKNPGPMEVWVDDDFTSSMDGWGITHFDKIQDGVNAVEEGGTVQVAVGIYTEVVKVDVEGITIRGENLDATVDGGFWLQTDYVTIDGLTVKNGFARSGSYRYAILPMGPSGEAWSTKGHTITNNELIGDGTGYKCAGIADGPDNSDDLVIHNNAIHGWRIGISFSGVSTNHMITENDIYENLKTGIELSKISNTTIEDNHIHDNTQWGIALLFDEGHGGGNVLHKNDIVANGFGVENHLANPLLDATNNWWGDASGPSGGVSDPMTGTLANGTGDSVSTNVLFDPWLVPLEPLEVEIDIKPGSDPNSINLNSKGVVPVAVLTTGDFDASNVDPDTVSFAGASPVRWTMEDVDDDNDSDMLFHFKTQELDLTKESTVATLTGETQDGISIEGTDTVNIVPKK